MGALYVGVDAQERWGEEGAKEVMKQKILRPTDCEVNDHPNSV